MVILVVVHELTGQTAGIKGKAQLTHIIAAVEVLLLFGHLPRRPMMAKSFFFFLKEIHIHIDLLVIILWLVVTIRRRNMAVGVVQVGGITAD